MYIANNFNNNSIEYFEQTDDFHNNSTKDFVQLITDKLITKFGENIKINQIYYDDYFCIDFTYNKVSGEIRETVDSRGNFYCVVDFISY